MKMTTLKQLLCIIGILVLGNYVSAQSKNLEKVVKVSANNKRVVRVLKDIELEAGITFSYKQDLFDPDKTVTINVWDKTLEEILKILFENNNVEFFEVGNQIVIYKTATDRIIEKKKTDTLIFKETITKSDTVRTVLKDTVYITDTLIITKVDTIIQQLHDTIVKTVYEKEQKPTSKKYQNTIEVFFKTAFYNNKLKLPSGLVDIPTNIKIQTSTKMSFDWSLGITGTKSFTNSSISIGVGIKNRLDNNEFFYKKGTPHPDDTIDIIDSAYIYEQQINKFQYLTIPVCLSWQTQLFEKTSVGFGMGIWINYLLNAEGISNKNRGEYATVDINDLPQKKIGADLMVYGSLTYSISSKWSLWLSPLFEVQLIPDFDNNIIFFKNRVSFGSMIGMRFNL